MTWVFCLILCEFFLVCVFRGLEIVNSHVIILLLLLFQRT